MDFFLNWCINCGKRSEYLYCSKECRLCDLKKKNNIVNDNNYTLEFKNRRHSHNDYKVNCTPVVNRRSTTPYLTINIPKSINSPTMSSSASSDSTNSDYSSMIMSSRKTHLMTQHMNVSIYSSPPKDERLQKSHYIKTMAEKENIIHTKTAQQQLLSPLSEKDNMEYENTCNHVFTVNPIFSEEEMNENSSHWYWSSSDDEDDDE